MYGLTRDLQLSQLPDSYAELETIYRQSLDNASESLAIVGPNGGEGCTSLILAMASRAAAAGEQVLVLELNFASPRLALYADRHAGNWDLKTPAANMPVLHHSKSGVNLLPAPLRVSNIHQFRDPQALRHLLENLLKIYTKVLIDCSPVNRQNRNNLPAETIAAQADTTLLLTLAGHSQESQILEAKERLSLTGANLIGCVINDRENPGLASELARETRRLDRYLPNMMHKIRQGISQSRIINQRI